MYSLLEIERKYGYNKRKNILEKRGRYLKKKECAYCKKEAELESELPVCKFKF